MEHFLLGIRNLDGTFILGIRNSNGIFTVRYNVMGLKIYICISGNIGKFTRRYKELRWNIYIRYKELGWNIYS